MNLTDSLTGGSIETKPQRILEEAALDQIYPVTSFLWYQSLPYGFAYTKKGDSQSDSLYYWLPINPQDIQISTPFATNIVNTLYGIVEEHSEQRWWDITIKGTTGIAPRYTLAKQTAMTIIPSKAREAYVDDPTSLLFGTEVQSLLGNLGDVVLKMKQQFEALTSDPEIVSGVKAEASGYKAFHDFYRFLLLYKQEVSDPLNDKEIKVHPLRFMNYKDGICWNAIPVSFTMNKSAESPMLYNYQIVMRGYNMKPISGDGDSFSYVDSEQFGLAGYGNSLISNTTFASVFNKALSAKNLVLGALLVIGQSSAFSLTPESDKIQSSLYD